MTHHQNHATGEYREIADLTETERHRLLAPERRRILITILSASSSPMQIETLAEKVAKREGDLSTVDEATLARTMGILHHTHLPMMTEMGIVEPNPETNQIEFADTWSY
jgi:predicted transcriptional regulator